MINNLRDDKLIIQPLIASAPNLSLTTVLKPLATPLIAPSLKVLTQKFRNDSVRKLPRTPCDEQSSEVHCDRSQPSEVAACHRLQIYVVIYCTFIKNVLFYYIIYTFDVHCPGIQGVTGPRPIISLSNLNVSKLYMVLLVNWRIVDQEHRFKLPLKRDVHKIHCLDIYMLSSIYKGRQL